MCESTGIRSDYQQKNACVYCGTLQEFIVNVEIHRTYGVTRHPACALCAIVQLQQANKLLADRIELIKAQQEASHADQ